MENEPIKVLQFNDKTMVPKNDTKAYMVVSRIFWGVVIVTIIGSIVFKEFLFSDASLSLWACFFITLTYLLKNGGDVRAECYTELWLYEDYMVLYVPKQQIGRRKYRMVYQKMFYKDIKECVHTAGRKRYAFYGLVEQTDYKYDKNGNVMKEPSFHNYADSMIYFYTIYETTIDFKKELEAVMPFLVIKEEAWIGDNS